MRPRGFKYGIGCCCCQTAYFVGGSGRVGGQNIEKPDRAKDYPDPDVSTNLQGVDIGLDYQTGQVIILTSQGGVAYFRGWDKTLAGVERVYCSITPSTQSFERMAIDARNEQFFVSGNTLVAGVQDDYEASISKFNYDGTGETVIYTFDGDTGVPATRGVVDILGLIYDPFLDKVFFMERDLSGAGTGVELNSIKSINPDGTGVTTVYSVSGTPGLIANHIAVDNINGRIWFSEGDDQAGSYDRRQLCWVAKTGGSKTVVLDYEYPDLYFLACIAYSHLHDRVFYFRFSTKSASTDSDGGLWWGKPDGTDQRMLLKRSAFSANSTITSGGRAVLACGLEDTHKNQYL